MKNVIFLVIFSVVFVGCVNLEGEGGNSSIEGRVFYIDYVQGKQAVLDTFPAVDEDIYIVYGNGEYSDDDVSTNGNGEYQITGLRKGKYRLSVYSADPYGNGFDVPVTVDVEISKRKETVLIENIYIYKSNKGVSTVKGTLLGTMFPSDESVYPVITVLGDEDVFLRAKDGSKVFDVKTNADGVFVFSELWPDEYELYFYQYSDSLGEIKVPKYVSVIIGAVGEVVDVGEIVLNKSDEGTAIVIGKVKVHNYNGELDVKKDEYYAQGEEVFIRRVGDIAEYDKVRTDGDGRYIFSRLRVGTYVVYAYSKEREDAFSSYIVKENVAVKDTVTIAYPGQMYTSVNEIVIIK